MRRRCLDDAPAAPGTLALAHGTTGHVVAASLGHKSESTTLRSYADPTAVESARRLRALSVLEGGKVKYLFETEEFSLHRAGRAPPSA